MTTATLTLAENETVVATRGQYAVTFDSAADPETELAYVVYDADGDDVDAFETLDEAVEDAERRAEEDAEEARQDRLSDARGEIDALLAECEDEALLARIKALLKWGPAGGPGTAPTAVA